MRFVSHNLLCHPPRAGGTAYPRIGALWRITAEDRPPPTRQQGVSPFGTIGSALEVRPKFEIPGTRRANFENAFRTASCASIRAFESLTRNAMINKTFSIILFVVAFAAAGLSQTPCTRYVGAGFSMCQPAGWTVDADDGSKFKSISGVASGGKRANANFSEDESAMTLSDYVDATNKYTLTHVAETGFTAVTLVSRTAVVIDMNERGVKSSFLEELNGNKLFGVQYIFDAGKKKLLITFTSFESEREANEKLFDATIKTLKIDHSTP